MALGREQRLATAGKSASVTSKQTQGSKGMVLFDFICVHLIFLSANFQENGNTITGVLGVSLNFVVTSLLDDCTEDAEELGRIIIFY